MLGLLCGGQGALSDTMFRLTKDEPEAAPVFAAAKPLLGSDAPGWFAKHHDAAPNRASQLLVVTATLALHACIAAALPRPVAVAGYSVGEMSAWSIAGIWPADRALTLTAARAEAMDQADRGGQLGYVRGLPRAKVEALAASHKCAIAIVDPGQLCIVGGPKRNIAALCEAAHDAGAAGAALLDVQVASHTHYLHGAVAGFAKALKAAPSARPTDGYLLFAGGDGTQVFDAGHGIAKLAGAVAHQVDWAGTLAALAEAGVSDILDLGPGSAMAAMARDTGLFDRTHAADDFRSVAGLRRWLTRDAGPP